MDIKRRWSRLRRTPIGVDVGSRLIKAVQLEPTPGTARGMRVAAAVVIPRGVLMSAEGGAAAPEDKSSGHAGPGNAPPGRAFGNAPAVPTAKELASLPEALERAGFSGRRVVL